MSGQPADPRLREIFLKALDKTTAEDRAAFLDGACGQDEPLRRSVEALLASHRDDSFLEQPVVAAPSTVRIVPANEEKAGTIIGRYKLLEKLGEGGFGAVWLAEQKEPVRRKVALKVIKLGMDTDQVVARFEAERQALALMDHPNIAKALDAGATEGGRPYFVMELVRGIPITKFCDENHLATRERLDLFIKVCHAVQHAHQKGIIHRDLKPSNVLVTLHDGVPVPKVIDFGIAKATLQELTDKTIHTLFQQFIGTPAYVSPEQAEMSGLDIDTRSDIYSLGVLIYELLTGVTPFDSRTLMKSGLDEMRRIIREDEPERPSTRLSALGMAGATTFSNRRREKLPALINLVRGDLDWIVMKCLEKDRTRRYETANGLAADLARHLNNEPVIARPPSAVYRMQKAWRRHKLAFTAAAAVIVALLAGFSISLWQARLAMQARNTAQAAQSAKETEARNAQRERDTAQAARAEAEDKTKKLDASLYLNRIALAHREITARPPNIQRAVQLLEECPKPMRGWEWHYLQRLWQTEPIVAGNFGTKELLAVSYSPDARWIAVAGGDGRIRILDAQSLQVRQTLAGHSNQVSCVIFDPANPDRLASTGEGPQVILWDWPTATKLHVWLSAGNHPGLSHCLAFSPDGTKLAANSLTTSVTLWSTTTFESLQRLDFPPGRVIYAVCFDPAGRRLALGKSDGTVALWDLQAQKYVANSVRHDPPISGLTFSPDGRSLAAISLGGGALQVWDANSDLSQPRFRVTAHRPDAVGLAFNREGDRLATTGLDRTVALWDAHTGQQVLAFQDFQADHHCVVFSPDGSRLVSVGEGGEIHLRDASPLGAADRQGSISFVHSNEVTALAVSPDAEFLASGAPRPDDFPNDSARVVVRRFGVPRPVCDLAVHRVFVFGAAFSPDGRYLVTTGDDSNQGEFVRLKVWDLLSCKEAFSIEPIQGVGVLFCLAYSPDGRRLVAADPHGEFKIWDALTGRRIGVAGGPYQHGVGAIVFSPNGRYLVAGGNDGKIRIWNGTHLDSLQSPEHEIDWAPGRGHPDSLAFSRDSHLLLYRSGEDSASIWDIRANRNVSEVHSPGHGVHALAFSPGGRWLASGGSDCAIKLWEAKSTTPGKPLTTLRGHYGTITRLRFVRRPDGLKLVSASRDGTVRIWNVPGEGPETD